MMLLQCCGFGWLGSLLLVGCLVWMFVVLVCCVWFWFIVWFCLGVGGCAEVRGLFGFGGFVL